MLGINMLPESYDLKLNTLSNSRGSKITSVVKNANGSLTIVSAGSTNTENQAYYNRFINYSNRFPTTKTEDWFEDGEQFSFSIDVRSTSTITQNPEIYFKSDLGYSPLVGVINNTDSRLTYTGTWVKSYNTITLHIRFPQAGTYTISNPKLEKGLPSPYTPAPDGDIFGNGDNLLRNSKFQDGTTNLIGSWSISQYNSAVLVNGKLLYTNKEPAGASRIERILINPNARARDIYTLTIRSNIKTYFVVRSLVGAMALKVNSTPSRNGEFVNHTITYRTTGTGSVTMRAYYETRLAEGDTFEVESFKLEAGHVSTPWCANALDVSTPPINEFDLEVFKSNYVTHPLNSALNTMTLQLKPNTAYTCYSTSPRSTSNLDEVWFDLPTNIPNSTMTTTNYNGVSAGRPQTKMTNAAGELNVSVRKTTQPSIFSGNWEIWVFEGGGSSDGYEHS